MIVLSEGAKTDRMRLAHEVAQISAAIENFGLDATQSFDDLSYFASIARGIDARDFANAYLLEQSVMAKGEQSKDILFTHQDLQIRCFSALDLPQHVAVIERYKELIRTAPTDALELSQESTKLFSDPVMQAKLDALAQSWSEVDTPENQQQARDKIIEVLNVEWRSRADYDAYWIDRIVNSETVALMKEKGRLQGGGSRGYMHDDLQRGLKAAGIAIIAELWRYDPEGADRQHHTLYLSDHGLVVLEHGPDRTNLGDMLAWPDMGFIASIEKPEPHKSTPVSPALNRMVIGMEVIGDIDDKLVKIFRSQSITIACLLHPIHSWHVYFGYGALGAPNAMLLGILKNVAIALIVLPIAVYVFDIFGEVQTLLAGQDTLFQATMTIIQVICAALLLVLLVAYMPVFLALWSGTVLRAIGRSPITEYTNLRGVGESNFITRLFGR